MKTHFEPLRCFLLLSALLLTGTVAQGQVRPDSIRSDSVTRLRARVVENNVTQTDTGRAYTEQRTRIRYKNLNDSTTTTEEYLSRTPATGARVTYQEREVMLKPNPNAQPDPADLLRQERQEWKDRIALQVEDLNEEMTMLENMNSTGTKSANEGWKTRRDRLKRYQQQLEGYLPRLDDAATAAQVRSVAGRIRPVLRAAKTYLEAGGR
jgi:hypothetical protein